MGSRPDRAAEWRIDLVAASIGRVVAHAGLKFADDMAKVAIAEGARRAGVPD